MSSADWLDQLALCGEASERAALLGTAPADGAALLQSRLVSLLYSDPRAARQFEAAGVELAALHPGNAAMAAYARRGSAHVAYSQGGYSDAVEHYRAAAALFAEAGLAAERARTQSSALQSLILLSRYDEAHQWAAEAEKVFLETGDVLRLARLDSNAGNIYFRQDRAREAVARYRRALEGFQQAGDAKDIAAVLSNLAVSLTNLGEFQEALAAYTQARDHCADHGLAPLAAQADYNIAYLHFLRGDYAEARRLYQVSRQHCEQTGDAYHAALCDLDEAEMSLELNLTQEGETLARRAAASFDELGLRYERAKALVSLAVARSQRGEFREPDKILAYARDLFAKEQNEVWPALIDLFRAILAFRAGKDSASRRLCSLAWRTLAHTRMPGRAAHCQILEGRLWLREGLPDRARAISRQALGRLGEEAPPSLRFHAKLLEGEAEEASGRSREALACYEAARHELEDLRGRLDSEDLRISILKDKLAVYEGLIALHLEAPLAAEPGSVDRALMLVQQAKSRSLADRLLDVNTGSESEDEPAELEPLRRDLNSCYRQIELALLMQRAGNPMAPVAELRTKARAMEAELLRLRAERREQDAATAKGWSAEQIRSAIPADTALLEYFECRGRLYLFRVTREQTGVVRLGSIQAIRHSLKLLQFQLGKYRVVPVAGASAFDLESVRYHLATLHSALLGDTHRELARYRRWIIAPHRFLHGVPFAALERDGRAVVEDVELLHAPSAAVWAACQARQALPAAGNWVIAVPDPLNPKIEEEARSVASLLGDARLADGQEATMAVFREAASRCSVLHLAAHGTFRRDNPMFSFIQLADGRLSLMDLTRARLNAGLVTLSACSTGRSVSVGGDELLGLMRGFLAAGARNLLVSLWEVDDQCTAAFMGAFYRALAGGSDPAGALRRASAEVRAERPHPYYWAPFILVGAGNFF
ncbi:MAG: CHAT domain-containing tetratricopeptide repeat protein [Bryobacteraceae bacterium]